MAGLETVTLVRRGAEIGQDRYGNPVYDEPTQVAIDGCMVEPLASDEPDEVDRRPVITRANVYTPHTARSELAGAPFDLALIRGEEFEISGRPADWQSGWSSWDPGLVLACLRVEG